MSLPNDNVYVNQGTTTGVAPTITTVITGTAPVVGASSSTTPYVNAPVSTGSATPYVNAPVVTSATPYSNAPLVTATPTTSTTSYVSAPMATSTTPYVNAPMTSSTHATTSSTTSGASAPVVDAAKAIREGQLPPNETIHAVANKAKAQLEAERMNNPNLNTEGRDVATKLSNVISAAQDHLQTKNADGKYQEFVNASRDATKNAAVNVRGAAQQAPTDQLPSAQLLKELAFSTDFRNALMQMLQFFRSSIFGLAQSQGGITNAAKQLASGSSSGAPEVQQTQEQMWQAFSQFMTVLTSKAEFRDALRGLWQFANDMSDPAADTAKDSLNHPQAKNAFTQARAILEELAGGYDLQPMINQSKSIRTLISNDPRMQQYLAEVKSYFDLIMNQPEMLQNPAEMKHGQTILSNGVSHAKEYRESIFVRTFFTNLQDYLMAIKNDPSNQRLATSVQEFGKTFITVDERTGKQTINTDAIGQLKSLLVPLLMDQLSSIPIGTIEGGDEKMDYRVEGIVLSSYDIVPDRIKMKYANDMEFNVKDLSLDKVRDSTLIIKIDGVRLRLNNVKFWFQRKTFPKLEDEGLANISIEGDGAELDLYVTVSLNQPFFTLTRCNCDIDRMRIKIIEAKHATLDKIVTSLFRGAIKRKVETSVEERVMKIAGQVTTQMNNMAAKVRQGASSAQSSVMSTVVDAALNPSKVSGSSSATAAV